MATVLYFVGLLVAAFGREHCRGFGGAHVVVNLGHPERLWISRWNTSSEGESEYTVVHVAKDAAAGMGSALLCRWLSSAVSISSPPILAGNTFGIKHIEMTAGIRVAEFGFSCPERGMGEPQRGNPYVTHVVRLEACLD